MQPSQQVTKESKSSSTDPYSHDASSSEKSDALRVDTSPEHKTGDALLCERKTIRLVSAFFALLTLGWGDGGEIPTTLPPSSELTSLAPTSNWYSAAL